MNKAATKTSLLHLSVEEENLAGIPFAVLERRVGRRIGKIEIGGTKVLPDGREMQVSWQVQGNSELGLPTEQDLDIFVALGVLTFRNNFAKTVTFTGREIAKILNMQSVHGKFYKRLKMAMDRFIPLRFRGIAATERQEDIKWVNVFQEASFTLDRVNGRCTGSVTWTDKLIQSMNSGFFRMLDASRYMELDGITGKHLYRFLAVAFEKADLIVIDCRKLASEHLGILTVPKYFSRLLQTLEPAFEQLIRIEVLGSYHVVDTQKWEVALHRHKSYVPERKSLLTSEPNDNSELSQVYCQNALERSGVPGKLTRECCKRAQSWGEFYQLERAARIMEAMQSEGVIPHVALSLIRKALETGVSTDEGRLTLDWCEIATETCKQKRAAGQRVQNPAGLIVRIAKDQDARQRIVTDEDEQRFLQAFRSREQAIEGQRQESEQRALILAYEEDRQALASSMFAEMPEAARQALRSEKMHDLKLQGRFDALDEKVRDCEIDRMIEQDLAKREAPPFEKWYVRRKARQAVLPFENLSTDAATRYAS